jgi:hypothetical protein
MGASHSQEWMKSMEVAQKLALTQNKLLFVMWEESTNYALPVVLNDARGKQIFVDDMLLSEELNEAIWELFVPVLLNETAFEDMYEGIKDKKSYGYLELFRDDTIKIMDVNGNILNTAFVNYDPLNIQRFTNKYALNTSMLNQEYRNYKRTKDFYTAYYLGAKYVDYAIYNKEIIRPEILELSSIYLDEAEQFIETMEASEKDDLRLRCELTRLKQDLILNKPRRVLRQLKRLDTENASSSNKDLMAFLYFTAYRLDGDAENMNLWKSELSSVNLKNSNFLIKKLRE